MTAMFFKSTSLGMYCQPTLLDDPKHMQEIFFKIYVVTLPLGIAAILATGKWTAAPRAFLRLLPSLCSHIILGHESLHDVS